VASDVTANFNATKVGVDGTLGMGFRGISQLNKPTIFETLVEENQLEEPVFGLVLAESNSELIIGGRDHSRYKGDLVYTPVNGRAVRISRCVPCLHFDADTIQGYWLAELDRITINGNDTQVGTKRAIIDSGSPFLLGEQNFVANIYANIPGSARLNSAESLDYPFWTCAFCHDDCQSS
jgi:hypothetical protein